MQPDVCMGANRLEVELPIVTAMYQILYEEKALIM